MVAEKRGLLHRLLLELCRLLHVEHSDAGPVLTCVLGRRSPPNQIRARPVVEIITRYTARKAVGDLSCTRSGAWCQAVLRVGVNADADCDPQADAECTRCLHGPASVVCAPGATLSGWLQGWMVILSARTRYGPCYVLSQPSAERTTG
jgi:hypothetical protein